MRLWVRLTFGQSSGQVDIWSDVPPWIRLEDQVDIWSNFGMARCTPSDKTEYQVDIWSDGLLAGQLQLVGHLTKCHLCIDVKDGTPQRSDLGSD